MLRLSRVAQAGLAFDHPPHHLRVGADPLHRSTAAGSLFSSLVIRHSSFAMRPNLCPHNHFQEIHKSQLPPADDVLYC